MADFAQAFQNDHNKISDAVERDQSAAGQVIPFQCAKSHDFFDALEIIYSWNAFPFPIIRINTFLHKTKTTSSEHKNFFPNEGIFILNLVFPSLVSHSILQNVH